MRNRLIIICLLFAGSLSAQNINRRILLSFNISASKAIGGQEIYYNNARFIRLFPNMKASKAEKISFTYMLGNHFGAGVMYTNNELGDWSYKSFEYYSHSKVRLRFYSPTVYIQSGRLINEKLRVFSMLGPMLSAVDVELREPMIYIYDPSAHPINVIKSSHTVNPGLSITTGISYAVNEFAGFSLSANYNYIKTNSVIYPDSGVNLISLEAGFILKILKVKKYYL